MQRQLQAALAHVHDGRVGSTQHFVFGRQQAASGLGQGEQARVALQHTAASQPTYKNTNAQERADTLRGEGMQSAQSPGRRTPTDSRLHLRIGRRGRRR